MASTRYWGAAVSAALAISAMGSGPAFASDTGGGGISAADAAFLQAAHQGNLTEITAGVDAARGATTSCVKRVGVVLVSDHRKLDADIAALAARLDVPLPTTPNASQRGQLAKVEAEAGTAAFDPAWRKMQEAGHRATLQLIDKELASGSNAEVLAVARAARPVIALHLGLVSGGTCGAQATP